MSALAWSPDGQYIASGSWDGNAQVWNAFTGRLLTLYQGHSHAVSALAWSPDGQYIASGSWDHTVRVWDSFTGETLRVNSGPIEFVDAVAWSPNGRYVASGDSHNTVLVWNPRTGTTLPNSFIAYTGGILESLAWSPDGRYLAFVCVLISPILLIWDLGRPERFHHMLRVLKLRSPMSLGTWALSSFGMCAGLTTVYQMAQDGLLNWLPFFPRLFKALPVRLIAGK